MCTTIRFSRLTKKGNRIEYRETPSKNMIELHINDAIAREWGFDNLDSMYKARPETEIFQQMDWVPFELPKVNPIKKFFLHHYYRFRSKMVYYRVWFEVKILKR